MMNEETLKTIVQSITTYFKKFEIGEVNVYPSYLGELGELPSYQFTGIVTLSGDYRGVVYFSASANLIYKIITKLNQPMNNDYYLDLVAEMSNIFAGNLRRVLGKSFNISVPITSKGPLEQIKINSQERPCIIPIEFQKEKSIVVIFFDKKEAE